MKEALTWLSGDPGKWLMTALVVMAVILIAWGIQTLWDRRR